MSDNAILAALKMTGKIPSGMTAEKLHAEAADQVDFTIFAPGPVLGRPADVPLPSPTDPYRQPQTARRPVCPGP